MSKLRLDEIDHTILDMLIENTRVPFTDIAKALDMSAGTVHVRVKKMEEAGIIQGSTLTVDYDKIGYTFVAYIGVILQNTAQTNFILERIAKIPYVVVAHVITGKYDLFIQIRAKDKIHAKEVIFQLNEIEGIKHTESMISLEECINDTSRLMHKIFREL